MALNRLLFLFVCAFCLAAKGMAQCNVKSIISPAKDTTVSLNSIIHLTSLSQNATSLRWVYQYINMGSGNTLDFTAYQVGVNRVYLIAQNGNCVDTSTINIIVQGNVQPGLNYKAFYGEEGWVGTPVAITATKDSGYFVTGDQYSRPSDASALIHLYLFKVNRHGCVLWSTRYSIYTLGGNQTVKGYTAIETSDGGFLVTGFSSNQTFIIKLTNTGKIAWHREFEMYEGDVTNTRLLKEVADGYLISGAGGTYDANGGLSNGGVALTKFNKQGNIVWSKIYSSANKQDVTGLEVINGFAYMSGYVLLQGNLFAAFVSKADITTGDVVWTKRYKATGNEEFVHSDTLNNKLLLSRSGDAGIGYMLINQDGSIALNNTVTYAHLPETATIFIKFMSCHNGDVAMFMQTGTTLTLQPYYVIWSMVAKFVAGQSQTGWGYSYRSQIPDATVGYDTSMATTMQDFGVIEHTEGGGFIRIDKFGFSGQHNTCGMNQFDAVSTPRPGYTVTDFAWQKSGTLNLTPSKIKFNYIRPSTAFMYDCPAYFKGCTRIALHGKDSICNLQKTYTYAVTRGPGCTNPATFFADVNAVKAIEVTDTSITVKFAKEGNFIIRTQLQGDCTTLKDSILVHVTAGSISSYSLGEDISICKGDSVKLHAGKDFVLYKWQNGSQDSVVNAADSGKYYVTVTDKCDYTYSDTIQVKYLSSLPVSLGPDIQKCNSDPLLITAPAGFDNYSWSPAYNMLKQDERSIKVFPSLDTLYTVKVSNKQGCTGFDTLRVTVLTSPPLQLVKDTSFCDGDTVVLIPAPGFTSYIWSNGVLSYTDSINAAGTYFLKAMYSNGCYSADTATAKSFARPVLQLPAPTSICEHSNYILNAGGGYQSYLWQDGSTQKTFNAATPGTYWVKVTDNNGCTSADTTVIIGYLQLPSGFLPAVDSVCVYAPISVKATGSWSTYLWNTGDATPSISVSSPGIYWLQVSDANNCYAKDTINIAEKNCINGIFFPSAFSPNGDGRNDLFKPVVHINVSDYYFVIYNRFGQKIFETKDPSQGWDGALNAVPQPIGTFIWYCKYIPAGNKAMLTKGTVVLLR